jgi:hypothetical protein
MNEIQLSFYTLQDLFSRDLWLRFFTGLERLLGAKLSHLDTNDPMRKKVTILEDAADYVCLIQEHEGSRRLFGKFGKSGVEIGIYLVRDVSFVPNSISLYFPEKTINLSGGVVLLYDVFVEGARFLQPFYSLCDLRSMVARKKKSSGFAVDLQAELIGIFWLTYFNKSYVEFFGQSTINKLACEKATLQDGVLIRLGPSPFSVELTREHAENLLGKASFVEPEINFEKSIGRNALTFNSMLKQ